MEIMEYINANQQQQIIETIKDRCQRFQVFEEQFDCLFFEPYTVMRHKHTLTSAVISGFAPGTCDVEGMRAETVYYGLQQRMAQPELSSETVVLHIYSNGASLDTNIVKDRCKAYNQNLDSQILFLIIVFTCDGTGLLKCIEACLPNQDGRIVERFNLYTA